MPLVFKDGDDTSIVVSTCTRGSGTGQNSFSISNSQRITGWTSVRVTRGIERCPSDFEVEFTEPYPAVSNVMVQPGDFCEVYLGTDLVISGFVDRYMPSYNATSHTVRISGRGRCQDLVDCSAKWTGGQFMTTPLLQIAQRLCEVYDINVVLADGANQGPPIPFLNVFVGESIYDVLERLCRLYQLLLYEQADGSLVLAQVGGQQAASGFKEGVNVLAASGTFSMDARFSDYEMVLQALDTMRDFGSGGNHLASAFDHGVQRFRYHALVSEATAGGTILGVDRINWEKVRRIGRSLQVRVTTDTWRDSAGVLWTPNTLVSLDLPSLKMKPQSWLIADVTHRRDSAKGTEADLLIMPPQAFNPQPIMIYPIAPDTFPSPKTP